MSRLDLFKNVLLLGIQLRKRFCFGRLLDLRSLNRSSNLYLGLGLRLDRFNLALEVVHGVLLGVIVLLFLSLNLRKLGHHD